MNKLLFLSWLILLQSVAIAQPHDAKKWHNRLTTINRTISTSFLQKDIAAITRLYQDSGLVCMPEFNAPLYSKKKIVEYYQQLLKAESFTKYIRNIYEVQQLDDHVVEIGNYEAEFTRAGKAHSTRGKYLNVWKIKSNDELVLISEGWGSSTPSDRAVLALGVSDALPPAPDSSNGIIHEVNARNQLLSQLVASRDGEKHATEFFTEDAIYLTYDTSMLIGMKQLKPYFIEHEVPSVAIDSISIRASRMIPLKDYVIEYGYYYVQASWNDHKEHATVTGKSTNIWKRENGKLMLYRQMVNHD